MNRTADDPAATAAFDPQRLRHLLQQVAAGAVPVEQALGHLKALPYHEAMDGVTLDHHRALRKGFAEVVLCSHKTPEQVARIVARLAETAPQVLATRASREQFEAVRPRVPDACYHELARVITLDRQPQRVKLEGVMVVAAGTSDLPVAEEAALTLEVMGHAPQRIYDVGVAGLHRLLGHLPALQSAEVVIVVAGMEGALPSVVGGLVSAPIIAVPTSVGYGASFHGLAALLGMLNACAAGITVVNIDNGFGAGYQAAVINRRVREAEARGQKT